MSVTFRYRHVCCKMNVFFRRFHKSIEVFSITVKILFHRNHAQERLRFARLLFKNNKKNVKSFKNRGYYYFS